MARNNMHTFKKRQSDCDPLVSKVITTSLTQAMATHRLQSLASAITQQAMQMLHNFLVATTLKPKAPIS
jgi:hypothetical protein